MKRAKWRSKTRQLQIGGVVLLVGYSAPRGKWEIGRISKVFPGQEGAARNVQVKTTIGEYKRSVQRCCPLIEQQEKDA